MAFVITIILLLLLILYDRSRPKLGDDLGVLTMSMFGRSHMTDNGTALPEFWLCVETYSYHKEMQLQSHVRQGTRPHAIEPNVEIILSIPSEQLVSVYAPPTESVKFSFV